MRHSPLVVLLSFLPFLASAASLAQVRLPSADGPSSQQSPPPKQGGRILTWTPPDHTYPPFGSQIRKAVLEIREQCKDKDGNVGTYAGTGFIMVYHDPRLHADQN